MEQLDSDVINGSAIVGILRNQESPKAFYFLTKRIIDICLCIVASFVAILILPVIIILISIDSSGPVIYKQKRLGKNGKPFTIYKFRTMYIDAEKHGALWASKEDQRITRIGRILRKFRIDELPQIVNILRGEMTIVGPRPEREIFYNEFTNYIPHFRERLKVVPGLTGWAQVNGGYELSPEQKLNYDLYYIDHRNIVFDIKCILCTVKVLVKREGAR